MSNVDAVAELMARIRRGDARAAEDLFQQFERQVRMEEQLRLRDPRLRRLIGDADVCQSVWLSFLVRARLGEFDVANARELMRLLAAMARNKVAAQTRRNLAARRDFRRLEGLRGALEIATGKASPSSVVAHAELLHEVRARLGEEERSIADLRAAGRKWADIASELAGTADARRIQLQRGAMGAVLKGRDPDLGRDVALKFLRDDYRDDADMIRRFVKEAQIGG